jgi:hypothetical protein
MKKPQHLFSLSLTLALALSWSVAPASFAQNRTTVKGALSGSYINETVNESSSEEESAPKESPEQEAERKKIEARYPLSITGQTKNNQVAHNAFLTGVQNYYLATHLFEAANKIRSSYAKDTFILKVEQQGLIKSRILPRDILQYGPEHAHVALRIRALEEAQKAISVSIANFSKASSMAPKSKPIREWLRISKDTLKVFKYHIRFYQISLQNIKRGLSANDVKVLASRWNSGIPPKMAPTDTLSTQVLLGRLGELLEKQQELEAKRKGSDGNQEKVSLDSLDSALPSIDFKVKQF